MAVKKDTTIPLNAVVGWNEGVAKKKDAIAIAQGYISKRFTAKDSSWYAVAPFLGGFLWEAQEGGNGQGYIQSVIEALSNDPSKQYWFPTGDRAFRVMMRDGKPIGILLSERESEQVFTSGEPPLLPKSKMFPAQRKGTAVLAVGMAMSGVGTVYLLSSMVFYGLFANPGPSVNGVDLSQLPHAQWRLVEHIPANQIVSKLEFSANNWDTAVRTHEVPGLQELIDRTQSLVEAAKGEVTPMPEMEDSDTLDADYDPASENEVSLDGSEVDEDETELSPMELLQRRVMELNAADQPDEATDEEVQQESETLNELPALEVDDNDVSPEVAPDAGVEGVEQ